MGKNSITSDKQSSGIGFVKGIIFTLLGFFLIGVIASALTFVSDNIMLVPQVNTTTLNATNIYAQNINVTSFNNLKIVKTAIELNDTIQSCSGKECYIEIGVNNMTIANIIPIPKNTIIHLQGRGKGITNLYVTSTSAFKPLNQSTLYIDGITAYSNQIDTYVKRFIWIGTVGETQNQYNNYYITNSEFWNWTVVLWHRNQNSTAVKREVGDFVFENNVVHDTMIYDDTVTGYDLVSVSGCFRDSVVSVKNNKFYNIMANDSECVTLEGIDKTCSYKAQAIGNEFYNISSSSIRVQNFLSGDVNDNSISYYGQNANDHDMALQLNNASAGSLSDNTVYTGVGRCLRFDGSVNIKVDDNDCINTGTDNVWSGVARFIGNDNVTMSGNTFMSAKSPAIRIDSNGYNYITNNIFLGTKGEIYNTTSMSNFVFSNNRGIENATQTLLGNLDWTNITSVPFVSAGKYDMNTDISFSNKVRHELTSTLTINDHNITITGSYHKIETQGGNASDSLKCIYGGTEGDVLFMRASSSSHDVTYKLDSCGTTSARMLIRNRDGTVGDVALTDANSVINCFNMGSSGWNCFRMY